MKLLTDTAAFRDYVDKLILLRRLIRVGKCDSEEADLLRDEMDKPWHEMSDAERNRSDLISIDLSTLEPGSLLAGVSESGVYDRAVAERLGDARQQQDFWRVLEILREQSTSVSSDLAASLRGLAYRSLQEFDVAVEFLKTAFQKNPADFRPAYMLMLTLRELNRHIEVIDLAHEVRNSGVISDANNKVLLAGMMFLEAQEVSGDARANALHEAIALFEAAATEIPQLPATMPAIVTVSRCHIDRGVCWLLLEDLARAADAFTDSLRVEPDNPYAYCFRGLVRLSTSPSLAMADFADSIARDIDLVWPFFYLAQNKLLDSQYSSCLDLCQRAIRFVEDPAQRSCLYQWMAASLAGMEEDLHRVRSILRLAVLENPQDIFAANALMAVEDAMAANALRRPQIIFDTGVVAVSSEAVIKGHRQSSQNLVSTH